MFTIKLFIYSTNTEYRNLNHTPFHKHQDPTSFDNCQRLLTQLVLYLLRTQSSPSHIIPLPAPIITLLDNLSQAFNVASLAEESDNPFSAEDPCQKVYDALEALLIGLWTTVWNPTAFIVDNVEHENPIPDPTICFIVCTQMNSDGTVKEPQSVTGVLAKLTYCMVCKFL